jgi:hypothetical protein
VGGEIHNLFKDATDPSASAVKNAVQWADHYFVATGIGINAVPRN